MNTIVVMAHQSFPSGSQSGWSRGKSYFKSFLGVVAGLAVLRAAPTSTAAPAPLTAEFAIGEAAETTPRDDVFPRLPVAFPGGVSALSNVEFSNLVGYRPMLLDLYFTKDDKTPRPLVIFLHGGGGVRGDSRTCGGFANFPAVLASLAARGYVVASVNYRLREEAKTPASIQDVKAALRFLRSNAAQYGIDPERAVVWGGSAGGGLAALTATSPGVKEYDPKPSTGRLSHKAAETATLPDVSDRVQGAVLWYGPGSSSNPIPANTPPILLVHGLGDTSIPAQRSKDMAERLSQAGVQVETLFIPDVGHGFIGKTLESTREASLLALRRTFDFIDKVTAKAK